MFGGVLACEWLRGTARPGLFNASALCSLLLLPDVTVPALLPALVPTAEVSWPPATRRHGSFVVACGAVSSGLPRPPARIASAHCEARRAPLPACASAARASQVIDGCRRAPNGTQAQSQTRVACFSLICPRDCASKARAQTLALRSAALAAPLSPQGNLAAHAVVCRFAGSPAEPHRQAHRRCTKRAHHRQNTASCSVFARPAVAVESGGRGPGCAHTRQSRGLGRGLSPRLPAGWKRAPSVRRLQGRRGHA
ncbi:hypothetical protein ERJ75_001548600 [Trypanosoma vivax]|nr:hypothetical protein ERJ75_001548600 [Trypanosoma vivax]